MIPVLHYWHNKLLFLALLPALVVGTLLSIYLTHSRIVDIEKAFREKGYAIASQISTESVNSLFSGNYKALDKRIERYLKQYSEIISITVTDSDNKIITSHSVFASEAAAKQILAFVSDIKIKSQVETLDDFPVENAHDNRQEKIIGKVTVKILNQSQQRIDDIIFNSSLLLLFMLAVTGMIVFPVSRKLTNPIQILSSAFEQLRQGQRGIRVPEDAKDELLKLQQGFNEMSQAIARHNHILNERVDQVSRELETTFNALEIQNAELDIARRQALESSRVKSEFLANMSHEIRTPMNGIIGFSDLLGKTKLNKLQRDYVKTISRSADVLLHIINDILDFSKLESGKIEIQHYPFDLEQCIEEAISILKLSAHDKGLELVSIIYNDVPEQLIGDRIRLTQILTNLLGNAIKFTASGEVVLRVMLNGKVEQQCDLEFSVTDTGMGITEEDQVSLFKPFKQASTAMNRGFGGTGLGLSICKSLTTVMGGKIEVESQINQGTTFSVNLPFGLQEGDITGRFQPVLSSKNILLFDDHQLSRLSVKNTLQSLGFHVTEQDSLDILPSDVSGKDLVVISLTASGIQEFDKNRADRIKQLGVPVLCLLSQSDEKINSEFQNTFGFDYLTKPVFSKNFSRTILLLLSGKIDPSSQDDTEQEAHDFISLADKKILIADDNEINQSLITALLQQYDAQIYTAGNGQEAFDVHLEKQMDLIFMDIHMPEIDGLEATQNIRNMANPDLANVPIIALTADIAYQDIQMSHRYGFDNVLIKPIQSSELDRLIMFYHQDKDAVLKDRFSHIEQETASTDSSQNELLVIDHAQALRITGGMSHVAEKLLGKLVEQLPGYMESIEQFYSAKDWAQLWQVVHKLHGATAVCGIPALLHAVNILQKTVKKNDATLIAKQIETVRYEVDRLKREVARL